MKIFSILLVAVLSICNTYIFSQDTIVLQPGPEDGIDAKSRYLSPDQNYGNARDITAHATDYLGPNVSRSYIYFDLSFIPVNSEILDARLSLYIQSDLPNYPPGQAGENASVLQRIIESWHEMQLTFNNTPEATELDQVYLQQSTYDLQNYEDIDVTSLVQYMVSNPDMNFGFRLKLLTEIANRTLCFASSDYEKSQYRPKLFIIVKCDMPVPQFSYSRVEDTYYFIDESDSAENWHWDFGDENFSNLQNPEHSYSQYGKYNVCLQIENECGTSQFCDSLNYCPLATSYFQYSASGDTVNFINLSNDANSWYWDFGDGYGSNVENPFHYYNEPGVYVVCLIAENECGTDEFCDTLNLTGINDLGEDELNITMFPNPSHGKLNLRIAGNRTEIDLVKIYDITGKEVYEIDGPLHAAIDIGSLKVGIYLVRIFSDERVSTMKLHLIY